MNWSVHYNAHCHYGEKNGSCNVPQSYYYEYDLLGLGENGSVNYKGNLFSWLQRQKQAKKGRGTYELSVEEEAQLQNLVDKGNLRSVKVIIHY